MHHSVAAAVVLVPHLAKTRDYMATINFSLVCLLTGTKVIFFHFEFMIRSLTVLKLLLKVHKCMYSPDKNVYNDYRVFLSNVYYFFVSRYKIFSTSEIILFLSATIR